jgi:demethylsterigmatocystin 6-O-methyltransferase
MDKSQDVGGGYGTQAIDFQKQYPNLPGKVIIEDLPETVKQLAQHPGVQALAQDFFQPQTIKGISYIILLYLSFVLIY